MQDFEKYFNTARKAELDNVPFDKDNIESLLQQHREAGSQNFFKRIISKYGKLKMYSILSLITATMLTLSSMMFDSGENKPTVTAKNITVTIDEETDTINNFESSGETLNDVIKDVCESKKESTKYIDKTKFEKSKNNSQAKNLSYVSDALFAKKQGLTISEAANMVEEYLKNHSFKDTTITFYSGISDDKTNESKIRWKHLIFEPKDWKINTRLNFVLQRKFNSKGENFPVTTFVSYYPEVPVLIRLLAEMEQDITKYCDIVQLKNLGICDIKDYFPLLDSLLNDIPVSVKNRAELLEEVTMYGQVSRTILDNPFKGFKYKDKGVLLDKSTLEQIGIGFEKNKITIPNDEVFIEKRQIIHADTIFQFHFGESYNKEYIDGNLYQTKQDVFEWRLIKGMEPKKDNFINSFTYGSPKPEKIKNNKNTNYEGYYYYEPTAKRANRISPIIQSMSLSELSQLKYLYESDNENLKQLYHLANDYFVNMENRQEYFDIPKDERDKLKEKKLLLAETQAEIIAKNAFRTLKYTKLIPIEIPVPYGVHTEEELASGDYSKITLWYYPDDNFLNALPDDIRNKIIKEMNLLESVVAGELPASDACQALDGEESLLGLCNLTDMAITDLTAAPNPTHGNCEISYTLTKERYTKVMLLDNSGRYVKDINNWQNQKAGEYSFNIDLSSLPKGNYNIAVFTNKNEKVMFKLMKK